jgi:hypothetical protein
MQFSCLGDDLKAAELETKLMIDLLAGCSWNERQDRTIPLTTFAGCALCLYA